MWFNEAKFKDNGGCGYVLKPPFMMAEDILFNPFQESNPVTILHVEVISGWQLPKIAGKEDHQKGDVIDPYVKISLAGIPADTRTFRTKTISIFTNKKKGLLFKKAMALILYGKPNTNFH
jgi:hypothetical protein